MGKCRFPGTYRLQFVVRDDYDVGGGRSTCTTARADSVVSCQCATTPSVVATRTIYESLYLCRGDNRRFQAVNISVDVTELDGFKLARCPAPFRRTTNPGSAEGTRMAALPEILRENNRVF